MKYPRFYDSTFPKEHVSLSRYEVSLLMILNTLWTGKRYFTETMQSTADVITGKVN
jgi:hypothetical protein